MDVLEAIQSRRSVRDFDSRPLSKELIFQILEIAARSPSGGNGQPWEIFVANGAAMEKIRAAYLERAQAGGGPPPRPGGTPPPAFIQERMAVIRSERMKLLGLDPADPASGKIFAEWGARLWGAPAMAVICMDKALLSYLDIGLLTQTICLAALGFGVESLIASGFVAHPDILRQELDIPQSLNIVIGVGLGYPRSGSVINTYRSPRRPIDEVVRYKE